MKSTEQIPGPASVKQETHPMLHAVSNSYPMSFTPPTWLGQEEIWIFYNITRKNGSGSSHHIFLQEGSWINLQ